jgi:hypothetical protein
MFVKLIFEDFEHFENRKRVTLLLQGAKRRGIR